MVDEDAFVVEISAAILLLQEEEKSSDWLGFTVAHLVEEGGAEVGYSSADRYPVQRERLTIVDFRSVLARLTFGRFCWGHR